MWRGLAATSSEIVVFADTDTEDFHEGFLLGLLGPLLCDPEIQLVKGAFRRPFRNGGTVLAEGGGRVTELMARPLLNLHAPELAVFEQPLAGETAARRALLEQIPFSAGYGVEIAMLIDCWRTCGLDALAQVDLGERQNRHQPLRDLSAMAYAVLVAAQTRFLGAGVRRHARLRLDRPATRPQQLRADGEPSCHRRGTPAALTTPARARTRQRARRLRNPGSPASPVCEPRTARLSRAGGGRLPTAPTYHDGSAWAEYNAPAGQLRCALLA